jgi:tRNA (pseudouridine54-N1)-methyltransferase
LGKTDAGFSNLHDAGRLDIVYECVVASLFLSHGLRRDVTFDAFLNGPPFPPSHLSVDGESLYDVRTDIDTWQGIIRKAISGKVHPGVASDRKSFEAFLKEKSESAPIFVLEEGGKDASQEWLPDGAFFVLGDHVGLPKKAESFALRFGEKISVGKRPYLAASCITIVNYLLDRGKDLVK